MAKKRDYYKVLGVDRNATADQIKSAYRKVARQLHPDVNKAPDASERFAEAQEAYDVLSDPEKRKVYDRIGHEAYTSGGAAAGAGARSGAHRGPGGATYTWSNVGGGGFGGANDEFDLDDISSIFEGLFGGGRGSGFGGGRSEVGAGRARARSARGRDIASEIQVPFETALQGGKQTVRISRGGSPQTIDVTIPKSTEDGARLRIRGAGQPSAATGPAGDLILTIRVAPHPLFRREELDISLDLPVTIAEATLGATVSVPTPTGSVQLKVPPGSASGSKLRLRGRGVETQDGRRGDLYAVIKIVAPKPAELTDADRDALEKIGQRLPNPRKGQGWT